jgi:hypothetical protein
MMSKHKVSACLFVVAAAWYGFFGLIGPNYIYPDPQVQAEVGADTMTVVLALMRVAAPWVGLVIAGLAAVVFVRERRH